MTQNVLVVNTYGGSLLLGARAAKANVIATLEDVGFGSDLQALNFPKIPRYEKRADWPEKFGMMKWRDIDVVAHPPCSAFSPMNYSNQKSLTRGTGTSAFACHQSVIDYALSHKARTLTIESVTGAYEGAHEIYEENAEKYSYRVNYIMINSASCGVPQWRERVWVVYHQLPKRTAFRVDMRPKYVTVKSIIDATGTSADFILGGANAQMRKAWNDIRRSVRSSWPTGNVVAVLSKVHDMPREDVVAKFNFFSYMNANPVLLDRDGFTPVVLQGGVLCDGDRVLTVEEHCAVMGFPRDYKWGRQLRKFRMYLSKGVCPPVATWIMKMVDKNASGWTGPSTHSENDFGGVIDLRPKKQEALALANGRPWPPPGKVAVPRPPRALSERTGAVIKARRDPDAPRGHRYVLVDEARCKAPNSPQAAFMLALLRKAGKTGMTRGEIVALAVKDPKGFPTNQPHDRAVGFFLSKFKGLGGLRFAE
jgi:site-specific DNA-cytosine methylase